eukprot:6198112-Pleurochrysis_carterae.AAC.1
MSTPAVRFRRTGKKSLVSRHLHTKLCRSGLIMKRQMCAVGVTYISALSVLHDSAAFLLCAQREVVRVVRICDVAWRIEMSPNSNPDAGGESEARASPFKTGGRARPGTGRAAHEGPSFEAREDQNHSDSWRRRAGWGCARTDRGR